MSINIEGRPAIGRSPGLSATAGLRNYYLLRGLVSVAWVVAAFSIGRSAPLIGQLLLIAYPAWDAIANFADASRNGGLARNRTQALNVAVSVVTTIAVAILIADMTAVLAVFGVWAISAGLLQLATGWRRWKTYGAQWAMMLSGAQSALAGIFMIHQSRGSITPSIVDVAPYAAFGAFYFLVSAIWLFVRPGAPRGQAAS
jgi:uncharacterized membrane protein HdeD (DUF308 family)